MKTKKIFLLFTVIAIAISSCQDGDLGLSSFQVIGSISSFSTTDTNLPSSFLEGVFYPTKAGTYDYSYDQGLYTYSGSYSIVQETGETWNGVSNGLLIQGAKGADREYTFDCDAASGSELSYKNMIAEHKDIIVNKTIYFNGGRLIINGKGVYDPSHVLHISRRSISKKK